MYKINKESNVVYQSTCDRCHSEFEYDNEEICRVVKGSDNKLLYKFVECPMCGYANDFNPLNAIGLKSNADEDNKDNIVKKHLESYIHDIINFLGATDKEEDDD